MAQATWTIQTEIQKYSLYCMTFLAYPTVHIAVPIVRPWLSVHDYCPFLLRDSSSMVNWLAKLFWHKKKSCMETPIFHLCNPTNAFVKLWNCNCKMCLLTCGNILVSSYSLLLHTKMINICLYGSGILTLQFELNRIECFTHAAQTYKCITDTQFCQPLIRNHVFVAVPQPLSWWLHCFSLLLSCQHHFISLSSSWQHDCYFHFHLLLCYNIAFTSKYEKIVVSHI